MRLFAPTKAKPIFSFILVVWLLTLTLTACGDEPVQIDKNSNANDSTFAQLLSYIPDNGGVTPVYFNDYAAAYKNNGITSPTLEQFNSKDSAVTTNYLKALNNTLPCNSSAQTNLETFQDSKKRTGYDFFQIDNEICTSGNDSIIAMRGRFDTTLIDKTLTGQNYQKNGDSNQALYKVANPAGRSSDNIGVSKNVVMEGKSNAVIGQALNLASGKGGKSLADNTAYQALIKAFGSPQSVAIYTRTSKDSSGRAATLLAIAYVEAAGDAQMIGANYYDSPDKAKQAQPSIEFQLRNNKNLNFSSPEVQGNLVVYRLKVADPQTFSFGSVIANFTLPVG